MGNRTVFAAYTYRDKVTGRELTASCEGVDVTDVAAIVTSVIADGASEVYVETRVSTRADAEAVAAAITHIGKYLPDTTTTAVRAGWLSPTFWAGLLFLLIILPILFKVLKN